MVWSGWSPGATAGSKADVRWLFYLLLILNVVYLVVGLVMRAAPDMSRSGGAVAAGEALVLLSELPNLPAASVTPAPPALPALCPVVGPWEALADADRASQPLRAVGYRVQPLTVQVPRERLHWVYLPPYPDREAALRTLRQLQAAGVDSFVVNAGDDANAISLGYFNNADSARGLVTKMRTSGYQAQARETARRVTEYWLRVDHASVTDDGAALRQLLAAHEALAGNHVACRDALPAGAASEAPEPAPSAPDATTAPELAPAPES